MDKKSCKVHIFGDEYSLMSDESSEHIVQAAQVVDSLMREISEKSAALNEKKVAVLAALRMASKIALLESEIAAEKHKEQGVVERINKILLYASSENG